MKLPNIRPWINSFRIFGFSRIFGDLWMPKVRFRPKLRNLVSLTHYILETNLKKMEIFFLKRGNTFQYQAASLEGGKQACPRHLHCHRGGHHRLRHHSGSGLLESCRGWKCETVTPAGNEVGKLQQGRDRNRCRAVRKSRSVSTLEPWRVIN